MVHFAQKTSFADKKIVPYMGSIAQSLSIFRQSTLEPLNSGKLNCIFID
jgi:hypothetical protein